MDLMDIFAHAHFSRERGEVLCGMEDETLKYAFTGIAMLQFFGSSSVGGARSCLPDRQFEP